MAIPEFPANAIPSRAHLPDISFSRDFVIHLSEEVIPALNGYSAPENATAGQPELVGAVKDFEASTYRIGQVQAYYAEATFSLTLVDAGELWHWTEGTRVSKPITPLTVTASHILKIWVSGFDGSSNSIINYTLEVVPPAP